MRRLLLKGCCGIRSAVDEEGIRCWWQWHVAADGTARWRLLDISVTIVILWRRCWNGLAFLVNRSRRVGKSGERFGFFLRCRLKHQRVRDGNGRNG